MAKKGKQPDADSYSHPSADRANLPTEQVEAAMSPDQREPIPFTPAGRVTGRDDDPVLAWQRRKDPTSTPYMAYPLYVREKVHPGAFARWLQSGNATDAAQQALFKDFNNLPSEDAKYEWYQHSGNWSNRLIHGDSSQVMASLAKREGLAGRVQMIYFDPPYGIKFKGNFQVATDNMNTTENAKGLPNDPRTIRAFRDTYKRGIHSYLDEMLEKLTLARELLHESGSMFIQIGKENMGRLMMLCDEVFGADNRIALIPYVTSGGSSTSTLPEVADYLLYYAKERAELQYSQIYEELTEEEKMDLASSYAGVEFADGTTRRLTTAERSAGRATLPDDAKLLRLQHVTSQGHAPRPVDADWGRSDPYLFRDASLEGGSLSIDCPKGSHWRVSREGLDRIAEKNRLTYTKGKEEGYTLFWKQYFEEIPGRRVNNVWHRMARESSKRFVVQTAQQTIERAILMATRPSDLVLDITCGSGTTASVAEEWGRRWITCDTSPVSIAIARQRIAAQTYTYHVLQDSKEGAEQEAKIVSKLDDTPAEAQNSAAYGNDPAKGFVLNRVPYMSASVLGYDKPQTYTYLVDQPVKARGKVRLASPFTVESATSTAFSPISGTFTAASDMTTTADRTTATVGSDGANAAPQLGLLDDGATRRYDEFCARVTDALLTNGVRNTSNEAVLEVSSVRSLLADDEEHAVAHGDTAEVPQASDTIHHADDRTLQIVAVEPLPRSQYVSHEVVYGTEGGSARAGLLLAPEGAAVHRDTIRRAAVETQQHIPDAEALVVVAYESELGTQLYADAAVGQAVAAGDHVGQLPVLHVRPHRDLQLDRRRSELTDDDKHRAFTLLGEPDIKVRWAEDQSDGVVITLHGFDTFDPSTGATEHGDAEDVACWMIDTDFDGESFFARRLHFPGGEKDMKKLAKALGVGLDNLRYESTLNVISAPIPVPERGRMAVRIITTTGDEMTVEIPDVTTAADKTL